MKIPDQNHPRSRAFTLVEVVLAIIIALGILTVLLSFYQQATNLRAEAIQQTEGIAASRLLLDRLTSELRCVRATADFADGFIGSSNSIQFIKTDVPSFASWTGGTLGRASFPATDLKRISYQLASLDGTNQSGLLRSEQPLVVMRQSRSEDEDFTPEQTTNSVPVAGQSPVIEEIRFLQFRYWSGTNWVDSWTLPGVPAGVEVSVGPEPATNDVASADSGPEVFRRVIYLAASAPAGTDTAALTNRSALSTEELP